MLNKKNIACLIFVFLSLKIYAEDDFNVISQCTDEYETSCDLVLINGNEKNIFLRNIKSPSIEEIGKEMGALPGNVEEKMEPYLMSFYDCFDVLNKKGSKDTMGKKAFKSLEDLGLLEVQPLAYIRGRTISNAVIIVDEGQNLSYEQLKALITRAGENTKIIICGDPDQCELNFINKSNSGLSQVIDKFKGQDNFAHVSFLLGERSELSDIAGKIL